MCSHVLKYIYRHEWTCSVCAQADTRQACRQTHTHTHLRIHTYAHKLKPARTHTHTHRLLDMNPAELDHYCKALLRRGSAGCHSMRDGPGNKRHQSALNKHSSVGSGSREISRGGHQGLFREGSISPNSLNHRHTCTVYVNMHSYTQTCTCRGNTFTHKWAV